MPGTPEATAYAIPTGTNMVVSTRPAIRSCGSQAASYRLSICNPGNQRFQPVMSFPLTQRAASTPAADAEMSIVYSISGMGEQELQVGNVDPSVVLEAYLAKRGDAFESELFMQRNARVVRQRNTTNGDMHAAFSQQRQQRRIERRADAATFIPWLQVDSGLRGVPIGASWPPSPRVGVANDRALHHGDEPRQGEALGLCD